MDLNEHHKWSFNFCVSFCDDLSLSQLGLYCLPVFHKYDVLVMLKLHVVNMT